MTKRNHDSYFSIGVVSWGYGCAYEDALGIYSNVSHFSSWLYDNMPDLNTCPPLDYVQPPAPVEESTYPYYTSTAAPERKFGFVREFFVLRKVTCLLQASHKKTKVFFIVNFLIIS